MEAIILNRLKQEHMHEATAVEFADTSHSFNHVTCGDLIEFGMIPEFIGRFPVITSTYQLSESELVSVLYEPRNSIMKQFEYMLAMHGVELICTPEAAEAIARIARHRGTGARGLRSIVENLLSLAMFAIPSQQQQLEEDSNGDSSKKYHSLVIDEMAVLSRRGVVLLSGDLTPAEYLSMQSRYDSESQFAGPGGGVLMDRRVKEVTRAMLGLPILSHSKSVGLDS